MQENFHKCNITHLKVGARMLHVKSGIASWMKMHWECRFDWTTARTTFESKL